MPRNGAKSCDPCRIAKVRCSLAVPCARCAKRHLDCRYPQRNRGPADRPEKPRLIRPRVEEVTIRNEKPESGLLDSSGETAQSTTAGTPAGAAVARVQPRAEKEPSGQGNSLNDNKQLADDLVDCGQPLQPRTRTVAQDSLTAKMLIGRIADYPLMMAAGKNLPPFIHPPCAVGQRQGCPPESPHTCLPETLAVCAGLAQMLHSPTPSSRAFVWSQINSQVKQLSEKVDFRLKVPLPVHLPADSPPNNHAKLTLSSTKNLIYQISCRHYKLQ